MLGFRRPTGVGVDGGVMRAVAAGWGRVDGTGSRIVVDVEWEVDDG